MAPLPDILFLVLSFDDVVCRVESSPAPWALTTETFAPKPWASTLRACCSALNARNFSQCDSLLMGDKCGAHTFPYIEVKNPTAKMEHEATTSKIGEDQIFYCQQRGLSTEAAIALIVNGYCKDVLNQLPMEFAVEAQKLLAISLEGSVG